MSVDTRKRLIPVLLLDRERRLVKTVRFGDRTYIGDPLNVVRIFNEKEVDEIALIDIDATVDGRQPDFDYICEIASECFMPLSYGGGIKSCEDCARLNRGGVEKFILGSAARNLQLVGELSAMFGSQAVSACVDLRRTHNGALSVFCAGQVRMGVEEYCVQLQNAGVGELIIQVINNDGMRAGYDIDVIQNLSSKLDVPLVALGGAGEYAHLWEALKAGASAAASGSAFCFLGRLRAVLLNYPNIAERSNNGA